MGLDNRLWLGSSDNETKSPFSCCGVIRCRVNNQRSETPRMPRFANPSAAWMMDACNLWMLVL